MYYTGRLFAYLLGLKDPNFISGYSSPELDIALMRNELDALTGVASNVVKQNPEFFEKNLVDFHMILEIPRGDKHPRFAQLPELESFAKTEKERKLLSLHRTFRLAGSPFALPPGTPKDRAEILRKAMRDMFSDPEFLAEAKKTKLELEYVSANEINGLVKEILDISPKAKEGLQFLVRKTTN